MDTKQPTLAEVVSKRRYELGLSTADVEKISRRGGKKGISSGYISMIENGQVKNPSPEKLRALSDGLNMTYAELSNVAVGMQADREAVSDEKLARINFGYEGLSKKQKEKVDGLIELLEREIVRIKDEK
jgi:transcriptional regulator with XRE-family HTH domain